MESRKNGLKNFKQNRHAKKVKKQRTKNSEMVQALSPVDHSLFSHLYFRWSYKIFTTK